MSDRYKIVMKAFIPYARAPDPEGWLIKEIDRILETTYDSEYHGDNHVSYDGATVDDYRVRRWIEFDWDGERITNSSPKRSRMETELDTNVWHKGKRDGWAKIPVYGMTTLYETIDGVTSEQNSRASSLTDCYGIDDTFMLRISSGNPGLVSARATGGVTEPFINSWVGGRFDQNGVLQIWGYTMKFPSYGLSIARFNGGPSGPRDLLYEDLISNAYDPKAPPSSFGLGLALSTSKRFGFTVGWK